MTYELTYSYKSACDNDIVKTITNIPFDKVVEYCEILDKWDGSKIVCLKTED